METFVLIIWIFGKSVTTQEFNTQAACEHAITQAIDEGGWGSRIQGVCVPK